MAEENNRDPFDEFLNRAEDDYEAEEEDDILNDVEDAEEDESDELDEESHVGSAYSEEARAQAMMVDMPAAHGEIVEGANGGEGTVVRTAFLGKEM